MRKRTLPILLIATLCGVGAASARAEPGAGPRAGPRAEPRAEQRTEPRAGPPSTRPSPNSAPQRSPSDDVPVPPTAGQGRLGIIILPISRELRAHLGAPADRGVLVDAVRPDSPAARAGLRVGDVVTEVDGDPARSASDVLGALADRKSGDEVAVVVIRSGQRAQLRARLDTDPGPSWRSRGFRRFELPDQLPDDGDRWFPLEGSPGELRGAIEDLRRRMEDLERRLERSSPRGNHQGRTDRI